TELPLQLIWSNRAAVFRSILESNILKTYSSKIETDVLPVNGSSSLPASRFAIKSQRRAARRNIKLGYLTVWTLRTSQKIFTYIRTGRGTFFTNGKTYRRSSGLKQIRRTIRAISIDRRLACAVTVLLVTLK